MFCGPAHRSNSGLQEKVSSKRGCIFVRPVCMFGRACNKQWRSCAEKIHHLGGAVEGEAANVCGDHVDKGVRHGNGPRVGVDQALVIGLQYKHTVSASAIEESAAWCQDRQMSQGPPTPTDVLQR